MNFKIFLALFISIISLNTRTALFSPAPITPAAIAGAILNHFAATVLEGVNQTAVPVAQSIVHNRYCLIGSRIAFWSTVIFFGYWIARYANDNRNIQQKSAVTYKNHTLTLDIENPVYVQGHNGQFKVETTYEENTTAQPRRNPLQFLVAAGRWLWQPPYNPATITRVWVPHDTKVNVHTSNPYSHTKPAIETHNIHGEQKIIANRGDIKIVEPRGHVNADTTGNLDIENFSANITALNFSHFTATRQKGSAATVTVLGSSRSEPAQRSYEISSS